MQENPGGCNSRRSAISTRCTFILLTLYVLVDVCTHAAKTARRVEGHAQTQAVCNPEGGRRVGGETRTQAPCNPGRRDALVGAEEGTLLEYQLLWFTPFIAGNVVVMQVVASPVDLLPFQPDVHLFCSLCTCWLMFVPIQR